MSDDPTPDELAAMLKTTPMRMLCRLWCAECKLRWQQPASRGNCPRCHSPNTRLLESESQVCAAKQI
jgi:Zn finger protein HypA/HybF involved in hydrogenase expression